MASTPILSLRGTTLDDAPMILMWEISSEVRGVTQSQQPLSLKFVCEHILCSTNLKEHLQQRWVISLDNGLDIGIIDLYDFCEIRQMANVGIYICPSARGCGYGSEALRQLVEYARNQGLRQLVAEIQSDNLASRGLFSKAGFVTLRQISSQPTIITQLTLA